eukprot:scaffold7212_cov165-Cylindrotheca_fusiformis.AAC.1
MNMGRKQSTVVLVAKCQVLGLPFAVRGQFCPRQQMWHWVLKKSFVIVDLAESVLALLDEELMEYLIQQRMQRISSTGKIRGSNDGLDCVLEDAAVAAACSKIPSNKLCHYLLFSSSKQWRQFGALPVSEVVASQSTAVRF